MFISQAECNKNISNIRAVTLLEIFIVVIIAAIIATIAMDSWQAGVENAKADNAKVILKAILQSEQSFFAWKNTYTEDWQLLQIDNPNNSDKNFTYVLTATREAFQATAEHKIRKTGFKITQEGNLIAF